MNFKNLLLTILCSFYATALWSTHNRAGEFTYEQIGELTIRVTLTTYTKTSSLQADRDSIEFYWGDGTSLLVGRVNGFGDILPNDIKRNFYIAEHTYPGRATYTISMTDPNRIGGILNVNPPNSIKIPFHVETTFTFLNSQFQGVNSSAVLLQPPIDFGCVGKRFIHNPNAYDPDGDSLSYELIIPFQDINSPVPNYLFPSQISSGPNNQIFLDPETGDFIWETPQRSGEYNIAFYIHEYRQGVLINSIIRDMQILVEDCVNEPPKIETINQICVVAGEQISFDVVSTDPDNPSQKIELTALGGPLETFISPAKFSAPSGFQNHPVRSQFVWNTQCEHISNQFYSVIFKAVDNFYDTTGLATLQTVKIKVVGPPPENVSASKTSSGHMITWDKPYSCELTENEFFRGFTVWRKENSSQFQIDTCSPGLKNRGYTPIEYFVKDFEDDQYFYLDDNVDAGTSYCYRITGSFAKLSAANNPFNIVESLPSNEVCSGLALDVPFITKVSVQETDASNGAILVEWTKPDPDELDTLANPGPYQYVLLRAGGMTQMGFSPVPGANFTSNTFSGANDTSFLDMSSLNTLNNAYSYQVQFFTGNNSSPYRTSNTASSVFLTATGSDHQNILSWEYLVPWENYKVNIYRKTADESNYSMIGTTFDQKYIDRGLVNGKEYCYYIETEGSYGFSGLPSPLLNASQIDCQSPYDAVPPCIPTLAVQNPCEDGGNIPLNAFNNKLTWRFDNCANLDDVYGYNIYFKSAQNDPFELLATVDSTILSYEHSSDQGIAGCYALTSLDTAGNESDTSNIICVENCPFYTLPNVFTPNEDGSNDIFKPFPYKFIDRIDLVIYNRWGQIVYETADPDINWTGKNLSGNELSSGVYFYTCRIFEMKIDGAVEQRDVLQGSIELIR